MYPRENKPDVDTSKSIEFQIIDWYIPDSDKILQEQKRLNPDLEVTDDYLIYMFGITNDSVTVCTKVTGFMPYFFVKPPPSWDNPDKQCKELKTKLLTQQIEKKWKEQTYMGTIIPKKFQSHLKYMKIVMRKDFYGFTNEQDFPYIKIRVSSMALFNVLKRYFSEPKQIKAGFKICESNLDPFLRFIHEKEIQPCGWVMLPANSYTVMDTDSDDMTFSRCAWNIEIPYEKVISKTYNRIAPLVIASFDIECTSSHGDFPVAKKDYKKLAVDLINLSRYIQNIDEDTLREWICKAFFEKIIIKPNVEINRLYTKSKVNEKKIAQMLNTEIMETIISLAAAAAKDKGVITNDSDSESDDEEELIKETFTVKSQRASANEKALISILTKNLPALKGDSIIQIGTTINIYGSDEIIYKHIVTLNSCAEFDDKVEIDCCDSEDQVIMMWKDFITRYDPDILIGYNIFGFDMKYIWERAEEMGIQEEFGCGFGRISKRITALETKQLSSSALGDNIMHIIDTDGIVCIDVLKVMQRDEKLDSYKLDAVAFHFLKDKKDDITPNDIFNKFGGSAEDRAEIAKYCIQDCALVNRLLHNRKVIENNVGMGNVCFVPLKHLFMRGQGIKIFSLVSKACRAKQFIIPILPRPTSDDDDGYEGAIVLDPQTGMYLEDPITVLDYSSLYPSSMISRNLSHDCFIMDEKYLNVPGIEYITVEYDVYTGKGDKKKAVGKKKVIFAQLPDGRKGIMPSILMMLLDARKTTRKKIEYYTVIKKDGTKITGYCNMEETTIVDGEEVRKLEDVDTKEKWIVKVSDIESMEETFSKSEQAILDARQLAYKITANSLYGQCGSRTSPIYLKEVAAACTATGREMICLARDFVTKEYNAEVIYGDSVMGYTPITILQNGDVSVVSIESLMLFGTTIPYPQFRPDDSTITEKEQIMPEDMMVWTHLGWRKVRRVIRHKTIKRIYRVKTNTGLVDVTEDHSLLNDKGEIIKPVDCNTSMKLLHFQINTEYTKYKPKFTIEKNKIYCSSQILAQEYVLALQYAGYHISIDTNNTYYVITYSKKEVENPTQIQSITEIKSAYNGYVYDIETEMGVFHAGIGNLIVKNTDSIFCKFPVYDDNGKRIYGKEALGGAIKTGQRAEKEIKRVLPAYQSLAYEKTLFPFILFSKKRYVGNLYTTDPNGKFYQKSMGIALKRRDYAPIVKIFYGGCINRILNTYSIDNAVTYLVEELQKLVNGEYPLETLIISKTLKGNYKDPTKIAHKVLADRMGERDEGNKPMVNDRIPFVYIKAPDAKLQGDKIEHPQYIRDNNIPPDYNFYITNQLMKPITQLFALAVEKLPGYSFPPAYFEQMDIELACNKLYEDVKKRADRVQALRMKEVEYLIFRQFLEPKLKVAKEKVVRTVRKKKSDELTENNEQNLKVHVTIDKKEIKLKTDEEEITKKFKGEIVSAIGLAIESYLMKFLNNKNTIEIHVNNTQFKEIYKRTMELFEKPMVDWNQEFESYLKRQDMGGVQEVQLMQSLTKLVQLNKKVKYCIV